MPGKTLDEIEHVVWGEPTFDSHLVTTCHRLRTKPIEEFTVEDLRIMIGQKISLDQLLPRAIVVLEREPLAEGDMYAGDLLSNVIRCDEWLHSRRDLYQRMIVVAERAASELGDEDDKLRNRINAFLATSPV